MRHNIGALGPISLLNDPVPVPLLVAPRKRWWAHCVWDFGGTAGSTGEAQGATARFRGGSGNVRLPSATETVRFVRGHLPGCVPQQGGGGACRSLDRTSPDANPHLLCPTPRQPHWGG